VRARGAGWDGWLWVGRWWCGGWVLMLLHGAEVAAQPDEYEEGRALAAELRQSMPLPAAEARGLIRLRQPDLGRRTVPFTFRAEVTEDEWRTIYETPGGSGVSAQRLTLIQGLNRPNVYELETTPIGGGEAVRTRLTGADAMVPFAGSDFWLSDLGLEFLHWPEHRIVREARIRMRKGRPCQVLESRNPDATALGYARVVSWVDRETGKPILAEAYGADGRLLKEFEVGGVTKVQGAWELKNLEMRNVRQDSRTLLEFIYHQRE
jgi:hypothetical protein